MLDSKDYETLNSRLRLLNTALTRAVNAASKSVVKPVFQAKDDLLSLQSSVASLKEVIERREDGVWKAYLGFIRQAQGILDKNHSLRMYSRRGNDVDAYYVYGGLQYIINVAVSGASNTSRDDRIFK